MPSEKGENVVVKTEVPAMRMRMEYSAGNGVAFAVEFFPDATVSKEELDDRLDIIGAALDRQKAKYEIPQLEHQIKQCVEQIEAQGRALIGEDEKLRAMGVGRRNGVASLPATALVQRDQTRAAIEQLKAQLVTFREHLRKRIAIVEGTEPPQAVAAE